MTDQRPDEAGLIGTVVGRPVAMTMLYFGAVGISAIADRRHARRTAAALA